MREDLLDRPSDAAATAADHAPPAQFRSFTLRRATRWIDIQPLGSSDTEFFYRKRAALTGELLTTQAGRDVNVSDLTVR
jgi:hypothetical protein